MSERARDLPCPIKEACIALGGISRATLYREVAAGRLELVKIRGGSFVMESEITRYLKVAPRRRAA